jgi:hypothetical protein
MKFFNLIRTEKMLNLNKFGSQNCLSQVVCVVAAKMISISKEDQTVLLPLRLAFMPSLLVFASLSVW